MGTKNKSIGEVMTGKGNENIPNVFFRLMTFAMKITDIIGNRSNKNFQTLGLTKGQIVVDYGCGPARYIKKASETVGPEGNVYAVDIHPLAIENVNKIAKKYGLNNVEGILARGYSCSIPDNTADVVYALDMFHMIQDPKELLLELARIVKPNGTVIIEDGHQPRSETVNKIESANILTISKQNKHHVVCTLIK